MGAWLDHAFDRAHEAGTTLRWGDTNGKPWVAIGLQPDRRHEGTSLDSAAFALIQHERPPADDRAAA